LAAPAFCAVAHAQQSFTLLQLDVDDPFAAFWYAIAAAAIVSTIVLLWVAFRLRRVAASGGGLEELEPAFSELQELARKSGGRAASPPDTPIRKKAALRIPVPAAMAPVQFAVPASPSGDTPAAPPAPSTPPPAPADEVLDAYLRARASADPFDREAFQQRYQAVTLTCWNHEAWRRDTSITLQFREQEYGWYLRVAHRGAVKAFPAFKRDLADERETYEGVFEYAAGSGPFRLVAPATLRSEGDGYVIEAAGRVEPDV
jgi:hypothetical protein